MNTAKTPPLLPGASSTQTKAILGAMRAVAETGGAATKEDQVALASADQYIFGHDAPFAFAMITPVAPAALASALAGSDLDRDALKFLTVMAFVDGSLDKAKIASVLRYASALGIAERYLDEIREAAHGRLQEVLADMTRCNMESITGRQWADGDVNKWLLPYDGAAADPALAQRFDALARLRAGYVRPFLLGPFQRKRLRLSGRCQGAQRRVLGAARFRPCPHRLRHQAARRASGLDLHRGDASEIPMAGHVLPVIFSWHLGVQINEVARDASGALDPEEFWHAWAAGTAVTVDTFAPDWDFWSHVEVPLGALREHWSIPAAGFDATR